MPRRLKRGDSSKGGIAHLPSFAFLLTVSLSIDCEFEHVPVRLNIML